jgi:hypothetical protein
LFHISSDKVIVCLEGVHIARALEKDNPREMLAELARNGTPTFAISFGVQVGEERPFIHAREMLSGFWLLVLLTEDATEVLIDSENNIVSVNGKDRSLYKQ